MTPDSDVAETTEAPSRSLPGLRRHLFSLVRERLWLQVLVAMFVGVGFGTLIGPTAGFVSADVSTLIGNWVALPGRLFLLAIQFVVVPLVVAQGAGAELRWSLGITVFAGMIGVTFFGIFLTPVFYEKLTDLSDRCRGRKTEPEASKP